MNALESQSACPHPALAPLVSALSRRERETAASAAHLIFRAGWKPVVHDAKEII